MSHTDKVLVALDTTDITLASTIITETADFVGGFKFGLEYFNRHGAMGVQHALDQAQKNTALVFMDLKFHDIATTVAGAVQGVLESGIRPHILNVHTAGGLCMMQSAKQQSLESADKLGIPPPLMVGVTILTSLNDRDIAQVGYTPPIPDQVVKMAELAKTAGLDGVVCSAHEIALIKSACGDDFKTIVPGIRPAWAGGNDQHRIMSPRDAISEGADYLVIGRPITDAENMQIAIQKIVQELS